MSTPNTPKPAQPVKAVLFDFGKVLSNSADPAAWCKMLAITGLDDARLHEAYWAYRHDYDRHALSAIPYWCAVAAHAGTTFTDKQIENLLKLDVDMWTSMNEPMVEFAQRLQRAGFRTGILSNIGDAIAQGIVARLPWLSNFYHCTWSYSLGIAKPESAIYLKTAEALQTAPENILFIDDRVENITAAEALAFQTILYDDHPGFLRDMRERGYADLLELGAVPAQLQGV
jgi:putative hydrolase of the HAD superfamily